VLLHFGAVDYQAMAIGRLTLAAECGDGFLLKHHERLDNRKNVPS
jgi:hypothetical protein